MSINATLIAQIIAFALMIWFINRVLWAPFVSTMQARTKRISEGLEAGERGRRELESASKRCAEMLEQAKRDAAAIVARAEAHGAKLLDDVRFSAQKEHEHVMALARAEIDVEVKRAAGVLRGQVAALAVIGAEQILRKEIDSKAHEEMLARLREEL